MSQGRPFIFDTGKLPDGLFRAVVKMEQEDVGEGFGETAKLAQREAARFVLDKMQVAAPAMPARPQRTEDIIASVFWVRTSEMSS